MTEAPTSSGPDKSLPGDIRVGQHYFNLSARKLSELDATRSLGLTEGRDLSVMYHSFAVRLARQDEYAITSSRSFLRAGNEHDLLSVKQGLISLEAHLTSIRVNNYSDEEVHRARDIDLAMNELAFRLGQVDSKQKASHVKIKDKGVIEALTIWSASWRPRLAP